MKIKFKNMIFIVLIVILVFFFDFKINYSDVKREIKFEYNGLFWCCLDRYSIFRYNSSDKPIKWFNYTVKLK